MRKPINSIAHKKNELPKLLTGLTEEEAIAPLKQEGYNELAKSQSRNFLAIVWETIKDRSSYSCAAAVSSIGSATVLCVEKTGTLTLNQMALHQLFPYQTEFRSDGKSI